MRLNDEVLKEYKELEAQAKAIEARRKELSDQMKAKGSFSTRNYIVSVETRSRTSLAGLEAVAEIVGKDVLESHGLIKTSQYEIVKVSKKE